MDVQVGLSYEAAALELGVSLQSEARSKAPTLSDKWPGTESLGAEVCVSDLPEGEVLSCVVHEYAPTTHKSSNQGAVCL